MNLRYDLRNHGWADVSLTLDGKTVKMTASYLNDALGELTAAVLNICGGESAAKATFMDEPGEHVLELARVGADEIQITVTWYDDWAGMPENGPGKKVISGRVARSELRERTLAELHRIFDEEGEAGYKKKWIEHEFPTAAMRSLEKAG